MTRDASQWKTGNLPIRQPRLDLQLGEHMMKTAAKNERERRTQCRQLADARGRLPDGHRLPA